MLTFKVAAWALTAGCCSAEATFFFFSLPSHIKNVLNFCCRSFYKNIYHPLPHYHICFWVTQELEEGRVDDQGQTFPVITLNLLTHIIIHTVKQDIDVGGLIRERAADSSSDEVWKPSWNGGVCGWIDGWREEGEVGGGGSDTCSVGDQTAALKHAEFISIVSAYLSQWWFTVSSCVLWLSGNVTLAALHWINMTNK